MIMSGYGESAAEIRQKRKLTRREEHLLLAGLMLYWGEGTKSGRAKNWTVELSNSDPRMIRLFLHCLRIIFRINEERLRAYVFCYPDQDVEAIKKFWSRETGIPLSQFPKPYICEKSTRKTRETKCGTLHLRYSDKRLFLLIEKLTKEYAEVWVGGGAVNRT